MAPRLRFVEQEHMRPWDRSWWRAAGQKLRSLRPAREPTVTFPDRACQGILYLPMIRNLRSRIYYLAPDQQDDGPDPEPLIRAALQAGVGMVQYRASGHRTRDMIEQAAALVRLTRRANVPLIVNNRVDVALAVGADGVHLGAHDMPIAYARRLMGPSAIVGATALTPQDARIAERDGATYIAVGAIYPSPTAPHRITVGLEQLARIHEVTTLPVCAVGGLDASNLAQVAAHGAELLAVASAIHNQPDPARAARELVRLAAELPAPRRPPP